MHLILLAIHVLGVILTYISMPPDERHTDEGVMVAYHVISISVAWPCVLLVRWFERSNRPPDPPVPP